MARDKAKLEAASNAANIGVLKIHPASDGGETGIVVRAKDWSATALGPYDLWPQSLKNYLHLIQTLPSPAALFWGRPCIQLYNDGYAQIMGPKHPRFLGQRYVDCWPEAEATFYPMMLKVLECGERVEVQNNLFPVMREDFLEEAYFTFSFSPLRDEQGVNAGILHLVQETTAIILAERRALAVRQLSQQTIHCRNDDIALSLGLDVLSQNTADLPFCVVYLASPVKEGQFIRVGSTGLPDDQTMFPADFDAFHEAGHGVTTELGESVRGRCQVLASDLKSRFKVWSGERWPECIDRLVATPIVLSDQQNVMGLLIAGISPRLNFDKNYSEFIQLLTAQLAMMLSAARSYEEERKTIEGLANVDRARTSFFANVSHELRTPLTLILAPVEMLLSGQHRPLDSHQRDALQMVHNNAVRLLQMVNSLLDFAKLAAEKVEIKRVAVDVVALSENILKEFQTSLVAKQLKSTFLCAETRIVVAIDAYLYERILFNLISNAAKFTEAGGEISLSLRYVGGLLTVAVKDTGIGISDVDCAKLFQKFHQVDSNSTRRFEGTGLGLALVREFTQLLEGTVEVQSNVGRGSVFTVHLPVLLLNDSPEIFSPAVKNLSIPSLNHNEIISVARPDLPRVLLAEDNPELAVFIVKALENICWIQVACDGEDALVKVRQWCPDLVISDVMMPKMNGFDLTKAIKVDPQLTQIPVLLLTAMTNRESLLRGWDVGANDYLFKPFHPRELEARVASLLAMVQWREKSETMRKRKEELESFSHMASHDLREPLRKISAFSELLEESTAPDLGGRAAHCIKVIRDSSSRMLSLIEALIDYSRLDGGDLPATEVDFNELAVEVLNELRIQDDTAMLKMSPLPKIRAVPQMMTVLLRNLLGNSLKYKHPERSLMLSLDAVLLQHEWHFVIADNGRGFDPAQHENIFIMFKRLHRHDKIPGDGMGLAICKRIVESHGGRIWAEGELDRGALFHFTLPAHKAEPL